MNNQRQPVLFRQFHLLSQYPDLKLHRSSRQLIKPRLSYRHQPLFHKQFLQIRKLFFRIPFYGGSSFHLGNTFTALTALLLDGVSGGLAGAIGLALADILAGDPGYAITTFVLKFIIGITCGAVAHKVFKLRDQDRHSAGYLVKVIVSAGSGLLLNVFTDPFLGYFRNVYIFGQEYTVAQALTKIAGGVTFVNSVASTACAVVLYLALRPALERAKLLSKGE